MADIYSVIGTAQNSANWEDKRDGREISGQVFYSQCHYTTTASTDAADVLYLVRLPKGATVVPALCTLTQEDPGTDVDFTVGYIGVDTPATYVDADAFSTAITSDSAGRLVFIPGVGGANPITFTQDAWVTATIVDGGTISVTAGQDFVFHIAWTKG